MTRLPLVLRGREFPTPVVLAPMAGVTNIPFRALCRRFGPGLIYVSEMVMAAALVHGNEKTRKMVAFGPDEDFRSLQIYGSDPEFVGRAVRALCEQDAADHIDMNFGCPVPKVTKKGGGAALPWKLEHFRSIVEATVKAAGDIPVTVKMRKGIDADHLTYLEAARAAEGAGVAAVALHARTAADFYSGNADWDAIGTLKETISSIPVLGNGDIWSAEDALRMVEQSGCDGIVVGRGCLGRPWLFGDLAAAFRGEQHKAMPSLGEVGDAFRRHAELLVEFFDDETKACRDIRKHVAWYFKGYPVGGELRAKLAAVESLQQMDDLLGELDRDEPYPGAPAEGQRGRAGTPKKPALPDRWLESRELTGASRAEVTAAELHHSGG